MEKFRIKEEKYVSGKSKFFPQMFVEGEWKTLSYNILGLNNNGTDWCTTLEDSQKLIENFRWYRMIMDSNGVDKIVEEKIYEVN
jgi:hypothetical protein